MNEINKTIIQTACGMSAIAALGMVAPYHAAYAKAWGWNYSPHVAKAGCGQPWAGHWSKHFRVKESLDKAQDGALVLYLDLDSLIVDFEHDLSEALPEGKDIGIVP